jgi:DNA-binding IclR family transcriptional regulator
MPANATAAGKAILAKMSDKDFETLFPAEQLDSLTSGALPIQSDLRRELAEIRKRGYAVSNPESGSDVSAVAAAVSDINDRLHGALAVTAPKTRADRAWLRDAAAAVVRSADILGHRLC